MPIFPNLQSRSKVFSAKNSPEVINKVVNIDAESIRPNRYQPRQAFGADIGELAESIRQNGILQPLTVRDSDIPGTYELIAGERRLRAAKLAGLRELPCIIVAMSDRNSAVMALVENIQRKDLCFFDEAEAISKLIEIYGLTQEEAAIRLGKSQPTVANKLRLLKLSQSERAKIAEYGLTERHARALLKLTDPDERLEAIENIRLKKLNVEHTERMIDGIIIRREETTKTNEMVRRSSVLFKDVRLFVNTITHAVDVMRAAGINAEMEKTQRDGYIEVITKIPTAGA
ncbi:MAG: ParB/RepB/Spo0J family partition protein [Ruminococcus sp.]|jgi:ParB family chromosome partitioning protein|nr:ParB/RepB/Spo0J family partition protein [Ruminococcus sp.]